MSGLVHVHYLSVASSLQTGSYETDTLNTFKIIWNGVWNSRNGSLIRTCQWSVVDSLFAWYALLVHDHKSPSERWVSSSATPLCLVPTRPLPSKLRLYRTGKGGVWWRGDLMQWAGNLCTKKQNVVLTAHSSSFFFSAADRPLPVLARVSADWRWREGLHLNNRSRDGNIFTFRNKL